MVNVCVDQRRRYIPAVNNTARVASIQNRTQTACINHGPVFSGPYCDMLIRIVPNDTIDAGTKSDSVGCMKDALNVYG